MLKVYLASRFSRVGELNGYANDLHQAGITVTSRWLLGGHEWSGTDDDALPTSIGARFAREDIEDLRAADIVVAFTEAPRASPSRGGRMVELGYALALGTPIVIVGPLENVFCCLVDNVFSDWESAREALLRWSRDPVWPDMQQAASG